jgi:hypothetical protein
VSRLQVGVGSYPDGIVPGVGDRLRTLLRFDAR